ncbi:hypothetical protein [Peribacillus sp. TH16]|nr:hypothetical protein [Peribacillus sp. TH16]
MGLKSGVAGAEIIGMTDIAIMKQTGHKTWKMVDPYVLRLGHVIK